jgi:site-specific recombinase XerD
MLPIFDALAYFPSKAPELKLDIPISSDMTHDYKHAYYFIYNYRGSMGTFNSYRREIERFLQWTWRKAEKNLKDLKRYDIENYFEFCQKPPKEWISFKSIRKFVTNEGGERIPSLEWRPFKATLSKYEVKKGNAPVYEDYDISNASLVQVFGILSSFFQYLIQEEYTTSNPVLQIRQKSKFIRKQNHERVVRRLSTLQLQYLFRSAEALTIENPYYERHLFVVKMMYGMYLRISELTATERCVPRMNSFEQDREGNWWFRTVGKGNKERIITVSEFVLTALKRYRKHLNLPELPTEDDDMPLLHCAGRPIRNPGAIYDMVQFCFDLASGELIKDGYTHEAKEILHATPHWLRHTGISDDVKIRPREHVRDDAGHSSGLITDRYIDIELSERHASAKHKKFDY